YEAKELPMPNFANVRDDAFGRGAFIKKDGLIVGVPRNDAPSSFGWVRMKNSKWMYKSTDDNTPYHNGVPRGFDFFSTGYPFVKEQLSLPPKRQNNRLFADLMMLKFNIAISALGTTE